MGGKGLILLSLLLIGCKTKYIPVETKVTERVTVTDTIIDYQLTPYRDSIVTRDTASYLSNGYGGSWAVYSGGMLHHSLFVFPQNPIQVEVPKTVITERETESTKIEKVEVEKKLSLYQRMCVFCFPILIFVVLCFLVYIIWRWLSRSTTSA